eukprot:403362950
MYGTCNCPYLEVDADCKAISGIKIGTAFDLTYRSYENLKDTSKVDEKLLNKLKPYIGKKSDPIQFLKENPIEFTDNEINLLDMVLMHGELENIRVFYGNNWKIDKDQLSQSIQSKIPYDDLTRGMKTVIQSFQRRYSLPSYYLDEWNLILSGNFKQLLSDLKDKGRNDKLKQIESQILTYCMDKCKQSSPSNLLFVLDGSQSIKAPNFQIQIKFIIDLLQQIQISQEHYQVGIILFSDDADLISSFSSNKNDLIQKLKNMKYPNEHTYTNKALLLSHKTFKQQQFVRNNSKNIQFILTDGQPTDIISEQILNQLRDLKVITYAVGVGVDIKNETLALISGEHINDYSRVLQVSDFNKLKSILNTVDSAMCTTPTPIDISLLQNFTLDEEGQQYLKIYQKYVYMNITLIDFQRKPKDTQGKRMLFSQEEGSNEWLDDVVFYYSFTHSMPNQYINDGQSTVVNNSIQLLIQNDVSNISKQN